VNLAKQAAVATVDVGKKVYADLSAVPTTVPCSNPACKTVLAVPEIVWQWNCVSCQALNVAGSKCKQCQVARPATEAPKIACGVCAAVTTVPTTVAMNYAGIAIQKTSEGVHQAANYTQKTYEEWKSRPETVVCSNNECKTLLAVPLELWQWPCKAGHLNSPDVKVCATCQEKRTSFVGPTVACPNCESHTVVANSVAQVKLTQAAQQTKDFTKATATAAKKQYEHWVAKPEQFNCMNCNAMLMVPGPSVWQCQTVGCGVSNNPDEERCGACNKPYAPKVLCGVCNQVTSIPASNVANSIRSTHLSGKKAASDVKRAAQFAGENKDELQAAAQAVQQVNAAAGAAAAQKES